MLSKDSISWRYMLDIAHGLEYLHDRGLVHQQLSMENLCTTSVGGVVSGMDLVHLRKNEHKFPEQKDSAIGADNGLNTINAPAFANDILTFGFAIADLISKPAFDKDDVWSLLVGLYNKEGFTWAHTIHKLGLLAQKEDPQSSTNDYHADDTITRLDAYTFDGQSISTMLDEAKSFCEELDDLRAVNLPVRDRLVDVYEQLKHCETPLHRRVVENFVSILQRINAQLDKRADYHSSQLASICASRTIAGKNYNIHHDIDRLISGSSSLSNENSVHCWQSGWESARQQQCGLVQALVGNSTTYLNGLNSDEERREAQVLLHHEARNCATTMNCAAAGAGGFAPTLLSIDEDDEVPDWFIPPYQIELGQYLAGGSFGAVYEGTWRGTDVVVKQVLTDQKSATARAQFRQEVDLWFSLNHDHLIKLYGACHVGRAAFVCEKATRGTLVSFAKGKERWEIWKCIYEAALGLLHLHDRGIIHGDLKGNNILVCEDKVKLADFGLSFVASQSDTAVLGSTGALGAYQWKAPECLDGGRPTHASDIYSFGMCVVEVLTGELPWGKMENKVVKYKVVQERLFPDRPDRVGDHDWHLASRMCAFDPDKRITATAVVSYAFDQYQALQYWHEQELMRNNECLSSDEIEEDDDNDEYV